MQGGWMSTQGVVGRGILLTLAAASGEKKHLIWLKIAQIQMNGWGAFYYDHPV